MDYLNATVLEKFSALHPSSYTTAQMEMYKFGLMWFHGFQCEKGKSLRARASEEEPRWA